MGRLIKLHDSSGTPFLLNADAIQKVASASGDGGQPIIGMKAVVTNIVEVTPQGARPGIYIVKESIEQIQDLSEGRGSLALGPSLSS